MHNMQESFYLHLVDGFDEDDFDEDEFNNESFDDAMFDETDDD